MKRQAQKKKFMVMYVPEGLHPHMNALRLGKEPLDYLQALAEIAKKEGKEDFSF
jgi:hypothetical protein